MRYFLSENSGSVFRLFPKIIHLCFVFLYFVFYIYILKNSFFVCTKVTVNFCFQVRLVLHRIMFSARQEFKRSWLMPWKSRRKSWCKTKMRITVTSSALAILSQFLSTTGWCPSLSFLLQKTFQAAENFNGRAKYCIWWRNGRISELHRSHCACERGSFIANHDRRSGSYDTYIYAMILRKRKLTE